MTSGSRIVAAMTRLREPGVGAALGLPDTPMLSRLLADPLCLPRIPTG